MRYPLLCLLLIAAVPTWAQETQLRHENFLVFNGEAGKTIRLAVTSIPRQPYHEDLRLALIDSQSRQVFEQSVPVGSTCTLEYPVATTGLHVLDINSGQPLATVRVMEQPFALIAYDRIPLWVCGECARQYFLVPKGMKSFDLSLVADVANEGARLRVWQPDGQVVVDRSEDFDEPTRVQVEVPAGMDAQAWSFGLDQPEGDKLFLDDVQIFLGRGLPPYLCEKPEWLAEFVSGAQAEIITERVALPNAPLRDGGTVELKFALPQVPQSKMVALRALGGDVDYPTEGTFTLNGNGPYAIPETGDAITTTVTVPLKREDLRPGDNVIVFKHDNRQSGAMSLSKMELLFGESIQFQDMW